MRVVFINNCTKVRDKLFFSCILKDIIATFKFSTYSDISYSSKGNGKQFDTKKITGIAPRYFFR